MSALTESRWTQKSKKYWKNKKCLNIHIDLHYYNMLEEYKLLNNCNMLIKKIKHWYIVSLTFNECLTDWLILDNSRRLCILQIIQIWNSWCFIVKAFDKLFDLFFLMFLSFLILSWWINCKKYIINVQLFLNHCFWNLNIRIFQMNCSW